MYACSLLLCDVSLSLRTMAVPRSIAVVTGTQALELDRRWRADAEILHSGRPGSAAARGPGGKRTGVLQPPWNRARGVRPDGRAPVPPTVRRGRAAGRRGPGRPPARAGPVDAAGTVRSRQRADHLRGTRQAPGHGMDRTRLRWHRDRVHDPAPEPRGPRRTAAGQTAPHPQRRGDPRPPAAPPLLRRADGLAGEVHGTHRRPDRRSAPAPGARAGTGAH